jgi:SAM-dependent methyltransferase
MTIHDSIPFEEYLLCESCESPLRVLCTLRSEKTDKAIRVGICEYCGYCGYIDRPSKQWIVSFYSKDWDQVSPRSVEDIKNHTELQLGRFKGSRLTAFDMYKELPTDFNKPVIEIGSGYGQILKRFYDAGFKKVYGVENSSHRATRVNEAFGFTVFEGDFGDEALSEKIMQHGPFGLVFSHHVLEHTYHPEDTIREISKLQNEGDALILALPNEAEHILYQVFYLPHLHSFTPESLEILLNKYGYELMLNNTDHDMSIVFGAVKRSNPSPKLVRKSNYFEDGLKRLSNALKVSDISVGQAYELFWEQRAGDTNYSSAKSINQSKLSTELTWKLRTYFWYIKAYVFKRFRTGYDMLLKRLQDGDQEGVEVLYADDIQMMMK